MRLNTLARYLALFTTTCLVPVLPAVAQVTADSDPPTTVTSTAADAFGAQTGVDRIGLYNEAQVRGFDLQQSGAYRIDDHYFVRATGLPEPLLSTLSVNVGITAATLDLPSPSGVVSYQLKRPDAARPFKASVGIRDFGTVHSDLELSAFSKDRSLSVVAGAILQPRSVTSTDQDGPLYGAGAVMHWTPATGHLVRAFASLQEKRYDGDFKVNPVGAAPPPALIREFNYSPDWAKSAFNEGNAGLLYEGHLGTWTVAASLTHSAVDTDRSDTTVLDVDAAGLAKSTLYWAPPTSARATAAEVKVRRQIEVGRWTQGFGVAVRARHSESDLADAVGIDAGVYELDRPNRDVARPTLPGVNELGSDEVVQTTASLSYDLQLDNRLDVRLGAHRTHYEKDVRQPNGLSSQLAQSVWFHNASVTWSLSQRVQVFASYVSGLEESGVAPAIASNRGDILAPVEARQWEVGGVYRLRSGLNLVLAYFDIEKPIAGLRSDGVYDFVGDVRHAGYEVSLSGRLSERTSIVAGAVALKPELSGPLVDSGASLSVPPGVSRNNITFNIDHRLNDDWSVDSQLIFEGKRRMRADSRAEIDGVAFLSLGASRSFEVNRLPIIARFQIVNALDEEGYYATPSNILVPIWSRTYRAVLSTWF